MNQFKTKRGLHTPYALLCGYRDAYMITYEHRCTMVLDGVYHVRLYGNLCANVINGTMHQGLSNRWYWQTYDTLGEARKGYILAKREVNRVHKL